MKAFKFTCRGAVGAFSGVAWPAPGEWLEAGGDELCRSAVHACRVEDLPWWLDEELWEVELDGVGAAGRHKLSARRGRLVRRIEGWDADAAREFSEACAWRAHRRALDAAEGDAAATLAACTSVADLAALDRELGGSADVRALVGMTADAAFCALAGAPAPAAYAAARAAGRTGGDASMDKERELQTNWFVQRFWLKSAAGGR
jgi:hypothetical protein